MAVPWYDNLAPRPVGGLTCMVEVERIYRFAWDRFAPSDWDALARSYEGLPGALGWSTGGVPFWFGDDEDVPPFLSASVEPPGLQVFGVLPEADWHAWDGRFRAETAGLPARDPG